MKKYILQFLYCVLVRNFLKLFIGVKFENTNFLLSEKAFILIANHNSHLDTMAILAALPHQIIHKVKPIAAKDYFGKTKFKAFLSNYFINTLLIERNENHSTHSIRSMVNELDKGNSLIVFPEGSRGKPEVMQPLKKGIALVLQERPEIKYIPVFMYGMGKSMPKGDGLIIPYNSMICFGEPHPISPNQSKDDIIHGIETELLNLKEKHPVVTYEEKSSRWMKNRK
jgi:1-acyl-sn-glycerol-3-phosphate acyltransferase